MPEQKNLQLVANAQQIVESLGFKTLSDYAVHRIQWKTHGDTMVALHDRQSDDGLIVLQALETTDQVYHPDGYHREDFIAGLDLTYVLMGEAQQQRQSDKDLQYKKAEWIAREAGYHHLADYALENAEWRLTYTGRSANYVACYEDQSPETLIVLDALTHGGQVHKGTDYYRKDYIADGKLKELLPEMDHFLNFATTPSGNGR